MRVFLLAFFLFVFFHLVAQTTTTDLIERLSLNIDLTQNDTLIADQFKTEGIRLKNEARYGEALSVYGYSMQLYERLNHTIGVANCLNNMALVYRKKGDLETAIKYYLKSRSLNEATGNKLGLSLNLLNLGNLKSSANEHDEAYLYFQEAQKASDELDGYATLKGSILMGLGNSFSDNENPNLDNDSAIYYYDLAETQYKQVNHTRNLINLLNNRGRIYENTGKLENALSLYLEASEKREGDKSGLVISNLNIGNVYYKMGKYDSALLFYNNGLSLAKEIGDATNYLFLLQNLVKTNIGLKKNAAALSSFIEFDLINDSIFNETKSRQIAEIETKYETEKKEQQIALQQAELRATNLEIETQTAERNRLMITLIVALTLTIIILIVNQKRQNAKDQLIAKEKQLRNQQVDDLLKEQEIRSLNALMEGQEGERRRIAEDLHDRLGSMLAATKLHYNAVQSGQDEELEKAGKLLDQTIEETRKIAYNLTSGVLTKFGLVAALNDLRDTIEGSKQISMEVLSHHIEGRLSPELEIAFYRIVQEAVSNILKHSKASHISVQLTRHDNDQVTLMIEDDGIGFEKEYIGRGMGLQNMKARASKFGGEINIDSSTGHGTTITIEVPLTVAA